MRLASGAAITLITNYYMILYESEHSDMPTNSHPENRRERRHIPVLWTLVQYLLLVSNPVDRQTNITKKKHEQKHNLLRGGNMPFVNRECTVLLSGI